jgi:hypothetical protein
MIEIFYSSLSDEQIRKHIEIKKELMLSYMITQDMQTLINQYREILDSHRSSLRKLIFKVEGKELNTQN